MCGYIKILKIRKRDFFLLAVLSSDLDGNRKSQQSFLHFTFQFIWIKFVWFQKKKKKKC